MNTAMGLLIACSTAVILIMGAFFLARISEWMVKARDEMRDVYLDPAWAPRMRDAIGVALWVVLEIICLVGALATCILMLVLAYQGAKLVRDWWHAGASRQ